MRNESKIKRNFISGIICEIVTILIGILVPRLTMTNYGSETNGLLSSVNQIYSYVSLLEAGVGVATIQALYSTIGQSKCEDSNAILSATNRFYQRTGALYMISVAVICVVYPLVVKTDIPTATIVLVIILNGAGSVLNYFVHGKYLLLLRADGRNYVISNITMVVNILKNVLKILFMYLGFSVVLVQLSMVITSLIQMAYITGYVRKNYAWLNTKEKPNFTAISQSKNVLVHRISELIYNSTDTIVLTVFVGLNSVSVYSLYTLLLSMVTTAVGTVVSSVKFSLGQMFHVDRKQFVQMYDAFELCSITLVFSLFSVTYFFILPFIRIYTRGVTDVSYVDSYLPILFVAVQLLSGGRIAANETINIAGHFKLTQTRAILEAAINLSVSLIAVQFWGIYGVLVGTIVALLYRTNDMIIYSSHKILERSALRSYKHWLINVAVFLVILFLNRFITVEMNSYLKIVAVCIPYTMSILLLYFAVAFLSEPKTARYVFSLLKNRRM